MQKQEQKQAQIMSPELSYKVMQIGELFLQIEKENLDLFDENMQARIKHVATLVKSLTNEMLDHHADRMLNWHKYVLKKCQMGFD